MNRLALEIKLIDLGYGGFGGKDLEGMSDEAIIKLYQEATSKANGGRIGYRIGGGPVKSFIAKLLNAEPSEEVMQRMVEERKKEILNEMFDSKAGTGAYSMKQMEEADKMATKQAMKELEEFKMRIGMDLGDPPEGSVADDMIDQIMEPREKGEFLPTAPPKDMKKEEKEFLPTALPRDMRKDGGRIEYEEGGSTRNGPTKSKTGDVLFDAYRDAFENRIGYPSYVLRREQKFGSELLDDPKFFGPDSMLDMIDFDKERFGPNSPIAKYLKRLPEKERKEALKKLRDFRANTEERIKPEEEKYLEKRGYMADGGIMNLNMGGMPAEMDLRGGGFVPLGAKEKADDVPARLSKNEFVMTADAVRAAGGGSVNKGAKRMYDLMNNLEARV